MADNVPVTAGSGVSIAADDIGGVHYQRVKPVIGADGVAVDAQPADADGKAATALLSSGGMVYNGSTWDRARSVAGDGVATTGLLGAVPMRWNGATFDRQRGNTEGTLLASAARTVATASATQTNYNARGVAVMLNVTVASGTGGLGLIIVGIDPVSSQLFQLNATPTTVTTTGKYWYEIYPGLGTATGQVVQRTAGLLSRSWLITLNVGDATSYTYSVGYSLIV
jgi:hypothetical protein